MPNEARSAIAFASITTPVVSTTHRASSLAAVVDDGDSGALSVDGANETTAVDAAVVVVAVVIDVAVVAAFDADSSPALTRRRRLPCVEFVFALMFTAVASIASGNASSESVTGSARLRLRRIDDVVVSSTATGSCSGVERFERRDTLSSLSPLSLLMLLLLLLLLLSLLLSSLLAVSARRERLRRFGDSSDVADDVVIAATGDTALASTIVVAVATCCDRRVACTPTASFAVGVTVVSAVAASATCDSVDNVRCVRRVDFVVVG